MDRAKSGWFFDNGQARDLGRRLEMRMAAFGQENMGQVVGHPLEDWDTLESFQPPDANDPWCFERIPGIIDMAGDRYVVVTCHFTLMERLPMLHGFSRTLQDFYEEPKKIEKLLDIILEFTLEQLCELWRRFGDRIDGLFLTDDWGSQQNAFISVEMFRHFFLDRCTALFGAIHARGWNRPCTAQPARGDPGRGSCSGKGRCRRTSTRPAPPLILA